MQCLGAQGCIQSALAFKQCLAHVVLDFAIPAKGFLNIALLVSC